MIRGETVSRPTKQTLANGIAERLGLTAPLVSRGSSVASAFLSDVDKALKGSGLADLDAYRKTERVLRRLGLPYDPWWDTSEAAPQGGSTVTTRAYSRILAAVSNSPRCFIINTTDHPVSAKYADRHESSYNYTSTVTGRKPLNDAGPGSRVVFYSTSNASQNRMSFTAHARVDYIAPGWEAPWEAHLSDYEAFGQPVPRDEVDIDGWNNQHSIVEITCETYESIIAAGGIDVPSSIEAFPHNATSAHLAERIKDAYSPPADPAQRADPIPDGLPTGSLEEVPSRPPAFQETKTGELEPLGTEIPPIGRTPEQRRSDRIAEQRAVEIARRYLEGQGWTLKGDHQMTGVGFDLSFTNDDRVLHVEVKGVQSPRLVINLTPKEWWRAGTDEAFVVVAVTSVLSPTDYYVHVITRDRLLSAPRRVTGYRIDFAASE